MKNRERTMTKLKEKKKKNGEKLNKNEEKMRKKDVKSIINIIIKRKNNEK